MKTNKEILKSFKEYREANSKSTKTIKGDVTTMSQLIEYTNNKPLKNVTENDLQGFLKNKSLGTKTQYAMRLINFYRWLNKLDKHTRPENMKWYEFPTADLKAKYKEPNVKKYLITDDEYNKIIQYCKDDSKWCALFETLYLSGARPNEANQMNVGDVIIDKNGKVTVTLTDSKTIPRQVPLPQAPIMLIRWIDNHPYKDNKDAPLFLSKDSKNYDKRMNTVSINIKFNTIKKYTGIKETLTPHCFRKTRATIYFSSRDPIYDDSEIAKIFGWKPHTVVDRRLEYDLRDFDDLKAKIQGNIKSVETYDTIKAERDIVINQQQEEINNLKEDLQHLSNIIQNLTGQIENKN